MVGVTQVDTVAFRTLLLNQRKRLEEVGIVENISFLSFWLATLLQRYKQLDSNSDSSHLRIVERPRTVRRSLFLLAREEDTRFSR